MSISGQATGLSLSQDRDKEHRSTNLLDRANPSSSSILLTKTQASVDQIVTDFSKNSTDWKTLASITAGGLAYQWAKAGSLPLRGLAVGLGFTAEVTAFEASHRFLQSSSDSPNLWRWEGRGGLKQGWISSFLTFGTLKGFGRLAEGQNWVLQHGAQDSGMVMGHQLAYLAGIGPKPEGNLAEQFFHAEALNLQLGAGMSLGRGLTPFYPILPELPEEKGIRNEGLLSLPSLNPLPAEAAAGMKGSSVSMMSSLGDGGRGSGIPPARARKSVPPAIDPLLGQVIDGRYKILNLTGQGGMGKVYTCTHTTLGKTVALKVLRPDLARDATVAQRFLDEARAATSIGSPHIIDVIDFGRLPDHSPYFVMEYLEGVPLGKLMEGDKPIPISRMIPIAYQLAEGLSAAHQKNIIHRDLKPGNIFLVQKGSVRDFVKILDFGIAKIANSSNELTMAGTILGTPRYMSPEQAEGKRVDQRSDIYSFGILLYKMASGKVPFDHNEVLSLLQAHLHEAPKPLVDLRPAPQVIPPGLDAIVLKCLAKDPAQRYQSMEEVKADLEKLNAGGVPEALSERSLKAVVRVSPPVLEPQAPATSTPTPTPITPKSARKPQNVVVVPPVKMDERRSRWPLILSLFGLGGAGALAVAYHNGKINIPWNTAPNSPTPAPTPPPAPPTADPSEPSATPSVSVAPAAPSPPPATSPVTSTTFPPPPAPRRKVEVTIDPADARLFHGDKYLGTSGALIEVEDGKKLEVEVRRPGYKSKKVTLDGTQAKTSIHLDKEGKAPVKSPQSTKSDPDPEEPPPPPPKYDDKFE